MSYSDYLETPPKNDEIEVSLFGPGFGESLAIHLGNGEWMTVDSCRNLGGDGDNALLSYLEALRIEVSSAVKLIVISHWDDDHISGVSELIRSCPAAKVAITSAFASSEFLNAIAPWYAGEDLHAKGLSELKKLEGLLKGVRPVIASSDKILFERNVNSLVEVRALSPSDAAVLACVARLRGLSDEDWNTRFPALAGNDCSIVLSIEVGNRRVLLGADLEVRKCRDFGWLAVVDAHKAASRKPYSLLKVAHHCSGNGDHPEIWQHLLTRTPHCIATPFVNGSVKIPSCADVERILANTDKAWITAHPRGAKFRCSDRSISKQMNQHSRRIEEVPRGYGHLRLRGKISDADSEWTIEMFGSAMELAKAV